MSSSLPQIQKHFTLQPKPLPPASELGFGKYFSDHWFLSRYSDAKGWYESQIVPYGNFGIDPAASVLHYGQALFEGMKAFRQKNGDIVLFRPDYNWKRMCDGAERLCLVAPPRDLFMSALKSLIEVDQRWVPTEDHCALYIRPTLIGTEGFLGVRPSQEMLFFVLLSPVGSYYAKGGSRPVKIWVEDQALRAAPGGLGATKAGANYAASLKSALEAKKKGYDQVLWLDHEMSGIEEVGTMNVFFVFKDEIVTPELNGSILAGGVRDCVLQLLKSENHGKNVVERKIAISEVVARHQQGELEEAFGTGTAAVITSIGELQYKGQSLVIHQNTMGPLSEALLKTINGIQKGLLPDSYGWIQKLSEIS